MPMIGSVEVTVLVFTLWYNKLFVLLTCVLKKIFLINVSEKVVTEFFELKVPLILSDDNDLTLSIFFTH